MSRRVCSISSIMFAASLYAQLSAENPPPACSGTPTHKIAVQVSLDGGSSWLNNSATMYLLPSQQRSIMARTLMTVTSGQTQGWSFSLAYDNSYQSYYGGAMSVTAATTSGTQTQTVQNGGPPDTNSTAIRAGYKGYTQGVVIDTDQVYTLSPSTDLVTSKACYSIVAGSTITSYPVHLKFTHDIGNPRIRSVVTQNARSKVPCVQNFTLTVSVNNYQSTTGGCSISGSGQMAGMLGEGQGEGELAGGVEAILSSCPVHIRRADSDNNGSINITDPIHTLNHLFQGQAVPCLMQADSNADNNIDVSDPIFTLRYLFLGLTPEMFISQGCGHAFGTLGCSTPSCVAPNPSLTGTELGNQSEPAVAINPIDPNNAVIVCNTWSSSGFFRFVTIDGGGSWNAHDSEDKFILQGFAGTPADPALAFDKFGNLFLAYQNDGLWIAISTDKGITFTRSNNRLHSTAERSAIATGPHSNLVDSTLWVSTTEVPGILAFAATVTGPLSGQMPQFSLPIAVTDCSDPPPPSTNRDCDASYSDIAVGPLGEVMVVYNNGAHQGPHTRPVKILCKMRDAAPPPPPSQADTVGFETKVSFLSNVCGLVHLDLPFDYIPARPPAAKGVVAAPDLAWDRSRDGRVYMVFTNKPELAGAILLPSDNLGGRAAIDCGGSGFPDFWDSDIGNLTGQSVPITSVLDTTGLVDPAPEVVYMNARRSVNGLPHDYNISNALNGRYRVRIHYGWATEIGTNPQFNISIEGGQNISCNAFVDAAGQNRIVIKEVRASVTDGNGLHIRSTPIGNNNAYEFGIEVIAENPDTEVFMVSALPGGNPQDTYTTWSAPVRVNSDTEDNSQFFPKIAVDQDTGLIAICWYDTRPNEGEVQDLTKVRMFARYSLDSGNTFGNPEFAVSCGFSDGSIGDFSTLGDYIGIDFFKNALFPAWGDNSVLDPENPNSELHTKRVIVP